MIALRRFRADEWEAYRRLRLRALADSPHAFGSTLAVEQIKPDAYWVERLSTSATSQWQLPLLAELGTDLVGLVWGWIDPSRPAVAQVFQMWVAPEARGLGCGSALLEAVIRWAKDARARSVTLRVTCGDSPARRLYMRAGFEPSGDPEPLRPGATTLAQPMVLDLAAEAG